MDYIELYKNKIIPKLDIKGLEEQKALFEFDVSRYMSTEQSNILDLINRRIATLKHDILLKDMNGTVEFLVRIRNDFKNN